MAKWLGSRVLWGILLILGGIAFLIQNMGFFEFGNLFWSAAFALGAVFFLSFFFADRNQWWAFIPGLTLLAISALIFLDTVAPWLAQAVGGVIVVGGISLAFWVIYFLRRDFWWAIIPAGVLTSVAALIGVENALGSDASVGVMFLGFGATFALVAFLPGVQAQTRWAWIPAGILGVMGLLFLVSAGGLAGYIWPLALVAGGLFLLGRGLLRR